MTGLSEGDNSSPLIIHLSCIGVLEEVYNAFMRTGNIIKLEAFKFLRDNYTAVIATCFEGKSHATTVYYDIDDDFNFYYLTKRNTQKNIHAAFNPDIAIVVGTGPDLITIQARGTTELLTDKKKMEVVLRMIARFTKKGIQKIPILTMDKLREKKMVAYKVTPYEMTFMNINSSKYPKSVSTRYHQIVG